MEENTTNSGRWNATNENWIDDSFWHREKKKAEMKYNCWLVRFLLVLSFYHVYLAKFMKWLHSRFVVISKRQAQTAHTQKKHCRTKHFPLFKHVSIFIPLDMLSTNWIHIHKLCTVWVRRTVLLQSGQKRIPVDKRWEWEGQVKTSFPFVHTFFGYCIYLTGKHILTAIEMSLRVGVWNVRMRGNTETAIKIRERGNDDTITNTHCECKFCTGFIFPKSYRALFSFSCSRCKHRIAFILLNYFQFA